MATIQEVRPDLVVAEKGTHTPIPPYPPDGHLTGRRGIRREEEEIKNYVTVVGILTPCRIDELGSWYWRIVVSCIWPNF
jgi:hypothetical protein